MKKAAMPKIRKLAAAKQRRLDQLLEKNSEGSITRGEKAALRELVAEAERLIVSNAKQLAKFSENQETRTPRGAVPVTIWIKPPRARRS
jgi:hypothetical protein